MNFEELGLTLQREREKKGLSIEVVMEATKISRTNIVAMENGDKSSLPHPVYTKGFVKSYARYLGLDPAELVMVVDREYQDEADGPEEHVYEVSAAAEKAFQTPDTSEVKSKKTWPLLVVLAFLVVIIVLLVMNLNGKNSDNQVEEAPAKVEETVPSEPVAPEAVESTKADDSAEAQEQEAVEEEAAAPEQAAEKTDQEMNDSVDQPAEAPVPETKPVPVPAAKVETKPEAKPEAIQEESQVSETQAEQLYDHVLIIRATTEKGCWIGLWKGDETNMYRDYVLKQGEPLRLMFNSPRRIRIGNVAGVTVTYNGKPYPLDGNTSNIQTLRFGE